MDLVLADKALIALDRDACLDAARRCVDASRRYGLASLPVALLWLAGAHALAGREAEMESVLAEADAAAPDNPRIQADAWGRVRATYWALRENRPALRHALDRSMDYTRIAPQGESAYPARMLWALLRATCDDDLGEPARNELAQSRLVKAGLSAVLDLVDAVILGRQHREDATAAVIAARTALGDAYMPWYDFRVVAEAAVRDSWGYPAAWLREIEAYFAGHGPRPRRTGMPGPTHRRRVPRHPPRPRPIYRATGLAPIGDHQPRTGCAHAGGRGAVHPGHRRPAVPVTPHRRTPHRQPARPHRRTLACRADRIRPIKHGTAPALTG